jgi:hypothetical protein
VHILFDTKLNKQSTLNSIQRRQIYVSELFSLSRVKISLNIQLIKKPFQINVVNKVRFDLHAKWKGYRRVYPKVSGLSHNEIYAYSNKRCWDATQRVMAAKLTRLNHKIAIQLQLVAECCTICSSRSRLTVRALLDTPSHILPNTNNN